MDGRIVVRSSLCDSRAARLVDFSFADVAVSTSSGKQLVHSVSGDVRGGRSLAIMGPSGAGKTTLLNTMALEPGVGQRCSGNIALNGSPFTAKLCQQHCAYCRQHDDLWWALSAEEHLRFAIALLRRRADVDDEVKELLGSMGLESCANTRAGNTLFRGLSGGQKRRLSLALALAKDPAVIFLDEPTSGLDAAAASSIMAFLRQTARQWNVAMLCTIHQPSASVFAGFDECLILSSGRIAYLGVAARLSAHLDAIGKPVPPYTNPCEHMLELVNADFSEPATVDAVITAWQQRAPPLVAPLKADLPSPRRGNLCRETRRLLRRHSLLIVRDPTLYVGRMAAFMAAGCFFATIYIKAREREQVPADERTSSPVAPPPRSPSLVPDRTLAGPSPQPRLLPPVAWLGALDARRRRCLRPERRAAPGGRGDPRRAVLALLVPHRQHAHPAAAPRAARRVRHPRARLRRRQPRHHRLPQDGS
jgi:ABC-type multidrug transport system ATPase subunit